MINESLAMAYSILMKVLDQGIHNNGSIARDRAMNGKLSYVLRRRLLHENKFMKRKYRSHKKGDADLRARKYKMGVKAIYTWMSRNERTKERSSHGDNSAQAQTQTVLRIKRSS